MGQADLFAKSYGLTMVEDTLFDLTNRRNISDAMRLVFPFGEAWGEFITRWGRLMVTGDRNIKNLRRLNQGVVGLRESDPFDPEGGQGFFHTNEYGDEVFTYPAFLTKGTIQVHNAMNNIPVVGEKLGVDIDPDLADNIESTGRAEALNFASGFIPGFGPVFQMGARTFIPEDTKWDFARDIVFPFGSQGGVTSYLPAWMKRVASAVGGGGDTQLEYTYTTTVQDVLRTMMNDGEFAGVTDQMQRQALVKVAEDRARALLMVRAAATFWQPTSPAYTFYEEDKNGLVWSYGNLGNEYRELRNELGDDSAAFDEFYRRFGFLPSAFTSGRTYPVRDLSITKEGFAFERNNKGYFDQYPNTAKYLDPEIDGEAQYSHSRHLELIERGDREQWNAEQLVYLAEDQLGDLMFDNASQFAANLSGDVKKQFMAQARAEIESLYPLWRKPVPGKRQGITNEEQMAEVIGWMGDPSLQYEPVVIAARTYLQEREMVMQRLFAVGGLTTLDSSTSDIAKLGREYLRMVADRLITEDGVFEPLYHSVFASEIRPDLDGFEPYDVDMYDEDLATDYLGFERQP